MTWSEHHALSEKLAAQAEAAALQGDSTRARELYREAGREESQALRALDSSKSRTLGVSVVSAASLLYKAQDFSEAEALIHRYMADYTLPLFASDELRGILQSIWGEVARQTAAVRFAPGEVLVSVKGGQI